MSRRWWSDTLFKRLFLLMWVALVASHLIAFTLVTRLPFPGDGGGPPLSGMPTFPSLPPTPGLPGSPNPPSDDGEPNGPPPLSMQDLLLDYGVRLLIIGAAAWWGARWLAGPTRRLVRASHSLSDSIGRDAALPQLDEAHGTVEVREAAQVFNDMARQLDQQFKGRGLMMAAISHDLRTPLTRMRMRLETMEGEPLAQRCIADLHEMNELLDSVLEVFRGAAHAEPAQRTDVLALVQSLGDDLVEQGHAVVTCGAPVIAHARPAALRRVVANLMNNAVRYAGGAEVSVLRDADAVCIVVEDRGPGIPEAEIEAVFQPFYRVEASRSRQTGGTGLGLYIARDLIQRQHGVLRLANRSGGGLRAMVRLPLRGA